jgi:DNA-binding transcriptional MerR regulator
MAGPGDALWTIEDLGNAVAAVLAEDGLVQDNGQIRDIPDRRTIRYYTTLGLIDRPAGMRGRTALYGERHLAQLVAIKRLQAEGLPLAEIQQRLQATNPKALKAIARIPQIPDTQTDRIGESFWSVVPDYPPEVAREAREEPTRVEAVREMKPALLSGVRLDPRVILMIENRSSLNAEHIRAIERAALPLLRLLRQRALIDNEGEET